jgi:hypothetical protein
VKINEVIVEAINTGTGTPNPEFSPEVDRVGNRNSEYEVEFPNGAPDFSGLKQAAQGAKMLGKGVANLPGAIKGAVQGYQASQQQRVGREEIQQLVKPWIQQWNKTVGQNPEMANDPAALQDFASRMTKGKVPNLSVPADTRTGTVEKYLSDAVGKYLYAVDTPAVTSTNKNTNQAPLTRAQQIKQARAQRAAQGTTPTELAPPAAPELATGVSVTSPEPIMFKFQGQNIGLGSQGQWVNTKTRKAVDEPMQAFFNQQHDKFLGVSK